MKTESSDITAIAKSARTSSNSENMCVVVDEKLRFQLIKFKQIDRIKTIAKKSAITEASAADVREILILFLCALAAFFFEKDIKLKNHLKLIQMFSKLVRIGVKNFKIVCLECF